MLNFEADGNDTSGFLLMLYIAVSVCMIGLIFKCKHCGALIYMYKESFC